MKTSEEGIAFIQAREGFAKNPYICPAGKNTIGYGHVITRGEVFGSISKDEAEILLLSDLLPREAVVNQYVDVALTQHEFDALVSFVYNLGAQAFINSTLLKYLNDGRVYDAANQFPLWCHATVNGEKVELAGLKGRRLAEKEVFLNGDYGAVA